MGAMESWSLIMVVSDLARSLAMDLGAAITDVYGQVVNSTVLSGLWMSFLRLSMRWAIK